MSARPSWGLQRGLAAHWSQSIPPFLRPPQMPAISAAVPCATQMADAVVDLELAAHPNPAVAEDAARGQVADGAGGELLRRAGPLGRRGAVADGGTGDVRRCAAVAAAVTEGVAADAGNRGGDLDRDQADAP